VFGLLRFCCGLPSISADQGRANARSVRPGRGIRTLCQPRRVALRRV